MSQFYNNIKTAFFLLVLSGLIVLIGSFFGQNGLIIALVFAAAMNFVSYFFSAKIAVMAAGGQEVGPDHMLYRIVEDLAQRANLPMPRVYVSPQQAPNAFATGRNPSHAAVCATQGLLAMLTPNEIAGVMAHEMSHVKHRDILIQSVAVTIGAAIGFLAHMAWWGGMFGGYGGDRRRNDDNALVMILIALLSPIAAGLIQAAISRSREFNADKEGANIVGDPMYLATALEKIERGNQAIPTNIAPAFNSMFISEPTNVMRSIGNLFQTHPPLEARLMNLIGRDHV
jgi:heat shock protein HtpX